jgi:cytochrome c553
VLVGAITTLGKTVLLVVAITFIVWSLYTALVIPKKHPGFPRRLDLFIVLSAALFVAQIGAVVWVTGTQEVEHEVTEEAGSGTGETETEAGTDTTEAPTAPGAGDAEAGAAVFESAGCASCHTLAAAKATGAVGPNLDELKPTAAQVLAIVPEGRGAMPAFADQLSAEEIANVAAYVSSVAGQ